MILLLVTLSLAAPADTGRADTAAADTGGADTAAADTAAADTPPDTTTLGVSLGYEQNVNDPFLVRRGLRLDLDLDVGRWWGLSLSGGAYTQLADITATGQGLIDDGVAPDLSRIRQRGTLNARFIPLRGQSGALRTSLALFGGGGVVHTVDDLVLIDATEDPAAVRTANQLHPTYTFGISGDIRGERWGARARVERSHYTEVVWGTVEETKNDLWVGLSVGRWW